jgi:hypothetical protein
MARCSVTSPATAPLPAAGFSSMTLSLPVQPAVQFAAFRRDFKHLYYKKKRDP